MKVAKIMKIFKDKDEKEILSSKPHKLYSIIRSIVVNGMKRKKPPKEIEVSLFFKVAQKKDILKIIESEFKSISKYNLKKRNDSRISPKQLNQIRLLIDLFNAVFLAERADLVINYEETSLYQLHKVICPVCGKQMIFKKTPQFNLYTCENKECNTFVSCHPNTALPAGLVSDEETRKLRKKLHYITKKVFKEKRSKLYSFLSKMIEREFDTFHGHIGSMNKTECKKLLNLFSFLEQRSNYLENIKGTRAYFLEENFISLATHKEMQAYYICLTKGVKVYKKIFSQEIQQSMFEKGFFNKNMKLDYEKVKIFI